MADPRQPPRSGRSRASARSSCPGRITPPRRPPDERPNRARAMAESIDFRFDRRRRARHARAARGPQCLQRRGHCASCTSVFTRTRGSRRRARGRACGRGQGLLRRRRHQLDARVARPELRGQRRRCRAHERDVPRDRPLPASRSSLAFTVPRSAAARVWPRSATSRSRRDDAIFGFTEVKLGIIPAVISPFVLGEDRPIARARALSHRRTLRRRARASDRAGARGRARRRARRRRRSRRSPRFARAGPHAVARGEAADSPRAATRRTKSRARSRHEAIAQQRISAEGQEGLRAFLERRKASFEFARDDPAAADRQPRRDRGARRARRARAGHRSARHLLRSRRERVSPAVHATMRAASDRHPRRNRISNVDAVIAAARRRCSADARASRLRLSLRARRIRASRARRRA